MRTAIVLDERKWEGRTTLNSAPRCGLRNVLVLLDVHLACGHSSDACDRKHDGKNSRVTINEAHDVCVDVLGFQESLKWIDWLQLTAL